MRRADFLLIRREDGQQRVAMVERVEVDVLRNVRSHQVLRGARTARPAARLTVPAWAGDLRDPVRADARPREMPRQREREADRPVAG